MEWNALVFEGSLHFSVVSKTQNIIIKCPVCWGLVWLHLWNVHDTTCQIDIPLVNFLALNASLSLWLSVRILCETSHSGGSDTGVLVYCFFVCAGSCSCVHPLQWLTCQLLQPPTHRGCSPLCQTEKNPFKFSPLSFYRLASEKREITVNPWVPV